MKKILLVFVIPLMLSCSEIGTDDTSDNGNHTNRPALPDPEGTVVVNAINDGDTRFIVALAGTIDERNNFTYDYYSSDYYVTDVGSVSGLGNMSDLMIDSRTFSSRCAVIPGHGYLMLSGSDVGPYVSEKKLAIYEGGTLYKVYVDSWITTVEGGICGAVLKYLPVDFTHKYTLPAMQPKTGFVLELPTDDAEAFHPNLYVSTEIKTENGKTYLYVSTEITNEKEAYGFIAVRLGNEFHEIELV